MKEFRTAVIDVRSDPVSDGLIIEGRAIVFDQATKINDPVGSYTEIIERSALDECDLSDVRLLYNHDLNQVPLARTPKTMSLKVDPAGMTIRANLPDTTFGREVYEAIKRHDLNGMSFAFKVPDVGGDTYDPRTNTRTIHKIEKVYECSVVPFPAYMSTSVEARKQIEDGDKRFTRINNLKKLIESIKMR